MRTARLRYLGGGPHFFLIPLYHIFWCHSLPLYFFYGSRSQTARASWAAKSSGTPQVKRRWSVLWRKA